MADKKKLLRHLPLAGGILLALLIGLAVWKLQGLFEKPATAKKQVQQVTLVQPPPPPPPPEVKPPPPEEKVEKIEEPKPEPEPEPEAKEPDEAPPAEDLGVDAEGGAGSDGFGLVGRKGGRGLLGGGGGNAIIWYGQQIGKNVESQMQNLLEGTEARRAGYSVTLDIWVSADGKVNKAELASSSGKPDVDAAIKAALPKLNVAISRLPPENMPQPLRIRLNSRL